MMKNQIVGVLVAVNNLSSMVKFYSTVLGVNFEKPDENSQLYMGNLGNLKITFCPRNIAGVYVESNNHQFEILVNNLESTLKKVAQLDGSILHHINKSDGFFFAAIRDPDHNSIVLKEEEEK